MSKKQKRTTKAASKEDDVKAAAAAEKVAAAAIQKANKAAAAAQIAKNEKKATKAAAAKKAKDEKKAAADMKERTQSSKVILENAAKAPGRKSNATDAANAMLNEMQDGMASSRTENLTGEAGIVIDPLLLQEIIDATTKADETAKKATPGTLVVVGDRPKIKSKTAKVKARREACHALMQVLLDVKTGGGSHLVKTKALERDRTLRSRLNAQLLQFGQYDAALTTRCGKIVEFKLISTTGNEVSKQINDTLKNLEHTCESPDCVFCRQPPCFFEETCNSNKGSYFFFSEKVCLREEAHASGGISLRSSNKKYPAAAVTLLKKYFPWICFCEQPENCKFPHVNNLSKHILPTADEVFAGLDKQPKDAQPSPKNNEADDEREGEGMNISVGENESASSVEQTRNVSRNQPLATYPTSPVEGGGRVQQYLHTMNTVLQTADMASPETKEFLHSQLNPDRQVNLQSSLNYARNNSATLRNIFSQGGKIKGR